MKIIIRLYRQHDLDLLTFKQSGYGSFQKIVRDSLRHYVRGIPFSIEIPAQIKIDNIPKSSQCHISLFEDKDADVIEWLNGVSKGFRNSLIKNLVRSYLSRPITDGYFTDDKHSSFIKEGHKTTREIMSEIMPVDVGNKPNEVMQMEHLPEILKPTQSETKAESEPADFDLFDEFESMMNF